MPLYGHGQASAARMAAPRAASQRLARDVEMDVPPGARGASAAERFTLTLVGVDSHGRAVPPERISLDGVEPIA